MDIPEWKGSLRRTWNWDLFLRGRQIKRELTAELGFFSLLVEGREEKERLFLNLVCLILLNAALWYYWLTFQACKARVLVIWNSYRIHILIKKKKPSIMVLAPWGKDARKYFVTCFVECWKRRLSSQQAWHPADLTSSHVSTASALCMLYGYNH